MTPHHVGKVVTARTVLNPRGDERRAVVIEYYNGGAEGGYENHDLRFGMGKEGGIAISEEDGEGFIYLYPEQVELFRKWLEKSNRRNAMSAAVKRYTPAVNGTAFMGMALRTGDSPEGRGRYAIDKGVDGNQDYVLAIDYDAALSLLRQAREAFKDIHERDDLYLPTLALTALAAIDRALEDT